MDFKSELEQQVWAATYASEWYGDTPIDDAKNAHATKVAIERSDKAVECLRAFPDLCPTTAVPRVPESEQKVTVLEGAHLDQVNNGYAGTGLGFRWKDERGDLGCDAGLDSFVPDPEERRGGRWTITVLFEPEVM